MKLNLKNSVLFSLVIAAVLTRFLPHPPNMTAVTALALFAGQKFESKLQATVLPLLVLFLSDLVIGFHPTMFFVYGAFALISVLSIYAFDFKTKLASLGSVFAASTAFFLISNFGVWITSTMYAKTTEGLVTCYLMGLPFFQNQVFGDLFYSAALFGGYAFLWDKVVRVKSV